jgi:hypothetical protein
MQLFFYTTQVREEDYCIQEWKIYSTPINEGNCEYTLII